MPNMSYCRFENTYNALKDCYYNLNNVLSDRESNFREQLVSLCQDILDEYDPENLVDEDDFEDEDLDNDYIS